MSDEKYKKSWNGFMKRKMLKRKGSSTNLREVKHEKEESVDEGKRKTTVDEESKLANRPRSVSSFALFESSNVIQHNSNAHFVLPKARKKPQFGMHPTDLFEKNPDEEVPAIVVACVTELKKDLLKEGIFRIPGRMTDILEMKISFEQGHGLGIEEPDTYAVAGLLSQFFRELPEPLLMYDLYKDWVAVPKMEPPKLLKRCLALMKKLPEANYNLLKYFIEFLTQISKHSGANRMGPKNLALVFGASLLNPLDASEYDLANIKSQCDLIEHLITNYAYLFEGEKEGSSSTSRGERQVATIPAGAPKPKPEKKKKISFFERAQFSGSSASNSRMCLSNDSIPRPKRILVSNSMLAAEKVEKSDNSAKDKDKKKKKKKKNKDKN